jgi:hypothetical protein
VKFDRIEVRIAYLGERRGGRSRLGEQDEDCDMVTWRWSS